MHPYFLSGRVETMDRIYKTKATDRSGKTNKTTRGCFKTKTKTKGKWEGMGKRGRNKNKKLKKKKRRKKSGQPARIGRKTRDINYSGKVEKRVRGQKTIGLVARSPLLTPTQRALWFNCPVSGRHGISSGAMRNTPASWPHCDCFTASGYRDSFIAMQTFDSFFVQNKPLLIG